MKLFLINFLRLLLGFGCLAGLGGMLLLMAHIANIYELPPKSFGRLAMILVVGLICTTLLGAFLLRAFQWLADAEFKINVRSFVSECAESRAEDRQ